jgi:predicted DNA-binding protein (UPF0251 family)
MPNTMKYRRVSSLPGITYFKPAGIPLRSLEEICISIEEIEAIKLKDIENLDQEQCAKNMNISRTTFQRVLESARKKLADALLNGKAIKIEGGNYEIEMRRFRCSQGHEWNMPAEEAVNNSSACPQCNSSDYMALSRRQIHRHGR